MKNLALVLNGLAVVMILAACHAQVTSDQEGTLNNPPTTNELKISQNPDDGAYNSVESNNPAADPVEKLFYTTPSSDIRFAFGGWGITSVGCSSSKITPTLTLETYDAVGNILTAQTLDYFSPSILLMRSVKYGVRARMTGTRGCNSVALYFTLNKTAN
jgi:hypothetical protein